MRRLLVGWLAFLIAVILSLPAMADKRVALVVGNARYETAGRLDNSEKDATLMAETLSAVGFTMVGGAAQLNLDDEKFRQVLKEFGEQLEEADIGLFYYAGHGVKGEDTNYLVPINATFNKPPDPDSMIEVNSVLRRMSGGARVRLKIIILDACRNNPFASAARSIVIARGRDIDAVKMRDVGGPSGGLVQMRAPKGTLIAFATEPGKTAQDGPQGGNSPYTNVLADTIRTSAAGILDMFSEVSDKVAELTGSTQVPTVSYTGGIDNRFHFGPPTGQAPKTASAVPAAPAALTGADIASKYEAAIRTAALEQDGAAAQQSQKGGLPAQTPVGLLSPQQERALKLLDRFKECDNCPEMVTVPAGTFLMGSPPTEPGHQSNEGPQQQITFARPFAVGRSAVTFDEWNACVAEDGCNAYRPGDYGWGRDKRPVINVSWGDAHAYAAWLSKKTGAPYRLLSEAEREYATRACTSTDCPSTPFWFGAEISPDRANYDWRRSYNGSAKAQAALRTVATDASEPNPFGLFQVHGNVREWVEDCWNPSLSGQPPDGTARMRGDCSGHVLRGGSWKEEPRDLRSAKRTWEMADERQPEIGFRVARTLRN